MYTVFRIFDLEREITIRGAAVGSRYVVAVAHAQANCACIERILGRIIGSLRKLHWSSYACRRSTQHMIGGKFFILVFIKSAKRHLV